MSGCFRSKRFLPHLAGTAMHTRYFALVIGIVYLLVGVAGFVPGLLAPHEGPSDLAVESFHGRLFGVWPVNILHNIVHLGIGLWGVVAYRSFAGARLFSRCLAVLYGVLAVMGLIPVLNTTFGLIPLHGNDVWLHALTALVAAYFGWRTPEHVEEPGGTAATYPR
jgi:uncharacterized protein DUF4383